MSALDQNGSRAGLCGGRMRSIVAGLIAACASLSASAALAQFKPEAVTGTRVPRAPTVYKPTDAEAMKHRWAACVYARNRKAVTGLLTDSDLAGNRWPAMKGSYDMAARRLDLGDCLGNEIVGREGIGLQMADREMRALLQEAAYLSKFSGLPAQPTEAAMPRARTYVSADAALAAAKGLGALADCIVANDPGKADAMIRSRAATLAEIAAAQQLAPSLSACLANGQTMTMNVASIRMLVADGLWQRYIADTSDRPSDAAGAHR